MYKVMTATLLITMTCGPTDWVSHAATKFKQTSMKRWLLIYQKLIFDTSTLHKTEFSSLQLAPELSFTVTESLELLG